MNYIETAMLIALIVLAIATVESIKLRRSIIYLGAFSLLSSFVYLINNAPDVAIAEAVIGCTISVILFLTALKKYKVMTIYYVGHKEDQDSDGKCIKLIEDLEEFLVKHEFEPQLVKTSLDDDSLHEQENFDLLVVNSSHNISIYSGKSNFNTKLIEDYINAYKNNDIKIDFISMAEDLDYEG